MSSRRIVYVGHREPAFNLNGAPAGPEPQRLECALQNGPRLPGAVHRSQCVEQEPRCVEDVAGPVKRRATHSDQAGGEGQRSGPDVLAFGATEPVGFPFRRLPLSLVTF